MPIVNTGVPITSELNQRYLQQIAEKYPFTKLEEVGVTDFQRPIWMLTTGTGKRHVLFTAAHHANEWITTPVLLKFVEDFAQAMGIPASEKYEHDGGSHMREMFDILRKYSANPIEDQLKLWDLIVFNYLIGNTDAHIKNFSLLYGRDLNSIRLAPAYDIVSTVVYEQSTRDMAFSVGGVRSIDDVDEDAFRRASKEVGLGERIAMTRYAQMCSRFSEALSSGAEALAEEGYDHVFEMKERILNSGGIRNISRNGYTKGEKT